MKTFSTISVGGGGRGAASSFGSSGFSSCLVSSSVFGSSVLVSSVFGSSVLVSSVFFSS
jgi:hypothetical protein